MATQVQDYNALLEAIETYYGTGSDQWVEIAKYGMAGDNAYNILRQTPGVTVTVSKSGQVLGYTVDKLSGINTQTPTSIINSNNQVAVMSNPTSLSYPADMSISQSTGKVVAESGMRAAGTGSKVTATLGKVAASVGAVASGIQLGALIDGLLYNVNPDFWDSVGMSSLNPETWDSLVSTQEGKDFFNMVFGINKDTGTTQAYMDENALAYIAKYMTIQGAFSTDTEFPDISENITFDYGNYRNISISVSNYNITKKSFAQVWTNRQAPEGGYATSILIRYNNNEYNFPLEGAILTGYISGNYMSLEICIEVEGMKEHLANYDNTRVWSARFTLLNAGGEFVSGGTANIMKVVYNNIDKVILSTTLASTDSTLVEHYSGLINDSDVQTSYGIIGAFSVFNMVGGGGVDGIEKQEDGTFPTGITADMTIAEVLALLQNQYPDLFTNGIYNDVVQPDGTVKRFNYVPVGIPDGFNYDETTGQLKPTGGELTKQGDTTITDDSTDDLLKQLIDLMTHPDPSNPEKTEDTNKYPDTGEGTTPSIIVPVGSASALYSIYNPTQAELNSFGGWLWSSNFVDQLLKLFNDPMQAIIGLHKVFATPEISGTGTIRVGYLDSGVSSKLVGSQYVTVDCGEVSLYEFFGNVFDYAPYTKVYIYLPFIGIMQIDTGEVMRGTIGVVYHVDVLTGACLAEVKVTRDNAGGTLYTYTGNCACQYPISSGSYMGIVASLASVVGGIIGTVASGGALAPVAMGAVSGVLNAHTDISHSGGFSGNAGAMGIKKPYLIIRRPQTALAENFQHFNGKPTNHYTLLSSCSGYVKCLDCHLEGIPATGEELEELDNILKSGIII